MGHFPIAFWVHLKFKFSDKHRVVNIHKLDQRPVLGTLTDIYSNKINFSEIFITLIMADKHLRDHMSKISITTMSCECVINVFMQLHNHLVIKGQSRSISAMFEDSQWFQPSRQQNKMKRVIVRHTLFNSPKAS